MARTAVRTFRSRSPRRATDWQLAVLSVGRTGVPAGTKVLIASIGSAALSAIAPGTIVRTRGIITIDSDQQAASEDQVGGFGVGLVNEVARALGVTALPGPSTDALWDGWFVHQFIQERFLFVSGVGVAPNAGRRYIIDSKAMRKFESDEGLIIMAENSSSTNGMNIGVSLRFLVKAG